MNRRALLKLAPAALAVGAAPALAAVPVQESPIVAKFREWEAMYRYQNGPGVSELTDAEYDAECDKRRELEVAIWAIPARDASDLMIKVIVETNYGCNGLPDRYDEGEFWAEARALIA